MTSLGFYQGNRACLPLPQLGLLSIPTSSPGALDPTLSPNPITVASSGFSHQPHCPIFAPKPRELKSSLRLRLRSYSRVPPSQIYYVCLVFLPTPMGHNLQAKICHVFVSEFCQTPCSFATMNEEYPSSLRGAGTKGQANGAVVVVQEVPVDISEYSSVPKCSVQ